MSCRRLTPHQRAVLREQLARMPLWAVWRYARQELGQPCSCRRCGTRPVRLGGTNTLDQAMTDVTRFLDLAWAPADYAGAKLLSAHRALIRAGSEAALEGVDTAAVAIERLSAAVGAGVGNVSEGARDGLVNISDGLAHTVRGVGGSAADVGWSSVFPLVILAGGGLMVIALSGGVQTGIVALAQQAGAVAKARMPL